MFSYDCFVFSVNPFIMMKNKECTDPHILLPGTVAYISQVIACLLSTLTFAANLHLHMKIAIWVSLTPFDST